MATDAEKAEALAVANRMIASLRERGWPEPIIVDSGNGIQLLYRGDGCDPNSAAWAYMLRHLFKLFGTPAAKVDTVVYNPARIARMPFTWNRKGESTAERPHRLATVISYPERWEPVNHGRWIYKLAIEGGYSLDATVTTTSRPSGDRPELVEDPVAAVEKFIDEYPQYLHLAGTFEKNDQVYYALTECPFAGRAHTGHVGKTSIILGDDFVGFSCFSDDCADHGISDLRDLLAEKTGHRSKVWFYVEQPIDLDVIQATWGGVDDLDDEDRPLCPAEITAILEA